MKASELIMELAEMISEFGDLEVRFNDSYGEKTIDLVCAYDKNSNSPKTKKDAVEIYLH